MKWCAQVSFNASLIQSTLIKTFNETENGSNIALFLFQL